MKKSIIILLVLFIGAIGYSQSKNKIKGSREVVAISMDLDKKFNALEIDDNITVFLSQGNKNSYVGYSGDADPHSGHTDPPIDFGLKRYFNDNITVFF